MEENETILNKHKNFMRHQSKADATIKLRLFYVDKFLKILNKQLSDIMQEDIENYFLDLKDEIKKETNIDRTNQKSNTLNTNLVNVRMFFDWYEMEYNKRENAYFKHIKEIRIKEDTTEKEYITVDDIKKLLAVCESLRDRAIIMLFYNSGARLSEIRDMNVGDVDLEKERITVNGKTGRRHIPIDSAVPYLIQYLNNYTSDKNAPLFHSDKRGKGKERISVSGMQWRIRQLAKETCIKKDGKKVNIHAFRHRRLTELATIIQLSEAELKKFAGWTRNSSMSAVYVHAEYPEMERKIRQGDGFKPKEETARTFTQEFQTIKCYSCGAEYPFGTKYCTCGKIIDEKLRIEKQREEEQEREQARQADLNEMEKHIDTIVQERMKQMFADMLKNAPKDIDEQVKKLPDVWKD